MFAISGTSDINVRDLGLSFMQVLILKTHDVIGVDQHPSSGPIWIRKGPTWEEAAAQLV